MALRQKSLGSGRILWLGVNQDGYKFSQPRNTVTICEDGIEDDKYRGIWRKLSGHDGTYIATDGTTLGDQVLNLRQITIVDSAEVTAAGTAADVSLARGMLRENVVVSFMPRSSFRFSQLPPMSRLVIGDDDPKVLILTEENGPCKTICRPIAAHFGDTSLDAKLREALQGRRGQMVMVRSAKPKEVHVGDTFQILPPLN